MNAEVLENIIEVVKNVEFYNNKLWENNNILVENKEITCNINNQAYYIEVENTDTVIFDGIYNKYNVFKKNLHGKSIYLFTLYYDKDMKDYFVRCKKD